MQMKKSVVSALLLLSFCVSAAAFAEGRFERNHPRRAEVLGRDRNLRRDIRNDRGDLNGQGRNLMAQDRRIQRQERRDARMNGGRLTGQQDRRLNREENRLHREVRQDQR